MLKLFSKLVGVNAADGPEKVEVGCMTDWSCVYQNRQATYRVLNGVPKFFHCGC